jgi:hypothetical protein
MSLALPNPFILLQQTIDRVSPLGTVVFVLFTSFVGLAHSLFRPSWDPDQDPDLLSVFPPPRT